MMNEELDAAGKPKEIARYDLEQPTSHMGIATMQRDDACGDWVRYDDHTDAITALLAERDALKTSNAKLEKEVSEYAEANHRQALCLNFTASALGDEISATIEGLPKAARHVRDRAEAAETRVAELDAAIADARRDGKLEGLRDWRDVSDHPDMADELVQVLCEVTDPELSDFPRACDLPISSGDHAVGDMFVSIGWRDEDGEWFVAGWHMAQDCWTDARCFTVKAWQPIAIAARVEGEAK